MKKPAIIVPHPLKTLLAIVAAIPALSACVNSQTQANKPSSSGRSFSLDSVPPLPVVNPASLKITDITIAQYADPKTGGTLQPLIDFRYSGSTDYVEAQACVEATGACSAPKNIFETKATLPNAAAGSRVIVKLRGCVNPGRSSGASNCGPWFEKEYTQWFVADKEKSQLQEEYDALERSAGELEKKLQKVLALRAKRAEKCKAKSPEGEAILNAERGVVTSMVKLGGGLVGAIANKLGERPAPAAPAAPAEPPKAEPEAAPVMTLALTFQGAREFIVGQASKYVPKIIDVLSGALKEKAQQILTSAGGSAPPKDKQGDSRTQVPESTTPERTTPESTTPERTTPESTSPESTTDRGATPEDGTPADSRAAAEEGAAQTAAAVRGSSVNWDTIADALPSLAEGIFDLANAERRIALRGICIDSLGEKQSQALQIAEEEVTNSVAQLRATAQSLKAKMAGKQ